MEVIAVNKHQTPTCDSCIHYVTDEDSPDAYCEMDLDEDERMNYSLSGMYRCPFYQFNDEYINVRKQI